MQRIAILAFGIAAYGIFFLTFLYLIAFVGNLQLTPLAGAVPALAAWVPRSIDAVPTGSLPYSVAIDCLLIVLFGAQHSIMARIGFKRWLKRFLPASVERSAYVLMASLALILLFSQWRPLTYTVWHADSGWARILGWSIYASGFGIVLLSTFLLDHFELFGLKQVWAQWRGREARPPQFAMPLFYRVIRHPIYLGFLLAFWGTATMTAGHLLFAAVMTGYILIAVRFEERDLVQFHGQLYERYRAWVPMLLPYKGWRRGLG